MKIRVLLVASLLLTAGVTRAAPVTYAFSGTHYEISDTNPVEPHAPLTIPAEIAGDSGSYVGSISGFVTIDPDAATPIAGSTGQQYGSVLLDFSLVINGLELAVPPDHWLLSAVSVLDDYRRADGVLVDGMILSVMTVLPPPADSYSTTLALSDYYLPTSALSSTAIPADLRSFAPWQAVAQVYDFASGTLHVLTADVELTSRTVPEPSCAGCVLALCAALLARRVTGKRGGPSA